ncbi:MAG: glycosyltransferase [Spirochaetaceae bacterium]|nr:glycosyltransferase [Spirochaetaceae bacterium]
MFSDCYFPRVNGVVVSIHSYAKELLNRGHRICIVTVEYPEEYGFGNGIDSTGGMIDDPNFSVVRIPSQSIIFSKEDRLARLDKWHFVKKHMDKFEPDVIHINSEWLVGYFGAMYARHRHIPCIFTFHTMWEDYIQNYAPILNKKISHKIGRDLVKFYLKSSDHILAPTPRIIDVVKEYGVDTQVDLLPTGIPEELFNYTEEDVAIVKKRIIEKWPVLRDRKILLFAGRIAKEKNLEFLLPVLSKVNEKLKGKDRAALLVAGDGLYMDEFKALAEKHGIQDDVFFLGYIKRNNLAMLYKVAHVFIFSSKTETQGLVTAEAMFAGLPVVAIGEMGTADIMQGDHGGFMVAEDTEIFADKVYKLLTDSNLHKAKSDEGKKWSQQWTMASLTSRLEEAYKKCVILWKEKHDVSE